jgi:murein endopeptidase
MPLSIPLAAESSKPLILELIKRLGREAAKHGLDFLLIGGQAVGILGHPWMTMDIDFLVRSSNKQSWEELLGTYG